MAAREDLTLTSLGRAVEHLEKKLGQNRLKWAWATLNPSIELWLTDLRPPLRRGVELSSVVT
jgi:hypothetical protein